MAARRLGLGGPGCWSASRLLGLLARRLLAALTHPLVSDAVAPPRVDLVARLDDGPASASVMWVPSTSRKAYGRPVRMQAAIRVTRSVAR